MMRKGGLTAALGLAALLATGSAGAQALPQFPQLEDNQFGAFEADADERMRRVVKILRTTDKAQVNQFVPLAYHFQHVNPYAVLRFYRRVVEVEEGDWWSFANPDGNSGIALVNVPMWQVEPLMDLFLLIDRPQLTSSSGTKRVYVPLARRDPASLVDVVEGFLTDTGEIIVDLPTGSLFIEDSPSGVDWALACIESDLDEPVAQIQVTARIYEIDLNNDGTIGLDYHAWKNGPGRNLFSVGSWGEYYHQGSGGPGVPMSVSPGFDVNGIPGDSFSSYGYAAAYHYTAPSAYFDYLVTKGRARVLTSPRATVVNAETASFSTGEQILFYRVVPNRDPEYVYAETYQGGETRYILSGGTVKTLVGDVIDRAHAGVILDITPLAGTDSIVLDLFLAVSSHLGFDDTGVPVIQTRDLAEKIRLTPGEEYIIGGMTRTRSIQTTRKIPVLGSLPGLGWLFGGEITTAKKTSLTIVLSADFVEEGAGPGPDDQRVIEVVETPRMSEADLPDTLIGFSKGVSDGEADQ